MKEFRSRISVLIIGVMLAVFIPAFITMYTHKTFEGIYTLGGILLFIILLFSGIRYIILENKLYIKVWFITNKSINITDIVSVKRSYNLLSSPAASLKRLKIRFANGWFRLISPVREYEFIEALKEINPDIEVYISYKKGIWRFWDWDI